MSFSLLNNLFFKIVWFTYQRSYLYCALNSARVPLGHCSVEYGMLFLYFFRTTLKCLRRILKFFLPFYSKQGPAGQRWVLGHIKQIQHIKEFQHISYGCEMRGTYG